MPMMRATARLVVPQRGRGELLPERGVVAVRCLRVVLVAMRLFAQSRAAR